MRDFRRNSAGDQFVMRSWYITGSRSSRPEFQAGISKRREIFVKVSLIIDLVERHPVLYFVLVASKTTLAKRTKNSINLRLRQPPYWVTVIRHLEMKA